MLPIFQGGIEQLMLQVFGNFLRSSVALMSIDSRRHDKYGCQSKMGCKRQTVLSLGPGMSEERPFLNTVAGIPT